MFQVLEQFASVDDKAVVQDARRRLTEGGMGWGELKDLLFDVVNGELGPLREDYARLMQPGSELDHVLAAGAERARKRAAPVLSAVRRAVGID